MPSSAARSSATTKEHAHERDTAHRRLQSKPKLEHTRKLRHSALARAFHALELASSRTPRARSVGYPTGARRRLLQGWPATESAWRKAPEPTRTTEPGIRVTSPGPGALERAGVVSKACRGSPAARHANGRTFERTRMPSAARDTVEPGTRQCRTGRALACHARAFYHLWGWCWPRRANNLPTGGSRPCRARQQASRSVLLQRPHSVCETNVHEIGRAHV